MNGKHRCIMMHPGIVQDWFARAGRFNGQIGHSYCSLWMLLARAIQVDPEELWPYGPWISLDVSWMLGAPWGSCTWVVWWSSPTVRLGVAPAAISGGTRLRCRNRHHGGIYSRGIYSQLGWGKSLGRERKGCRSNICYLRKGEESFLLFPIILSFLFSIFSAYILMFFMLMK